MSNTLITLHEGFSSSDQSRFNTAATLDGDVRITHTPGTTAHTAATLISVTAATVTVPSTTFTAASTSMTGTLDVVGDTTLSNATASGTVTANGKVVTNSIEAKVPATDTLVMKAKKITLDADVQITGNLDTVSTRDLLIKDKTITLGAVDADEDDIDDLNDTTRDGAGLIVPGEPQYLPVGKDAENYAHFLKWKINNGDFTSGGDNVVPHRKPLWEFGGGGVSISAPDFTDRTARFFFAPYFTNSVASLGLYYGLDDGRVKLVHTFSTSAFGGPPVFVTTSPLPNAQVGVSYTTNIVATGAVSYTLESGAIPSGFTPISVGSPIPGGVLSGTPDLAGTYAFTVRATGSVPALFTLQAFTIEVD